MSGHVAPLKLYAFVFGSLLVLTGVTVGVAYVDLGPLNTLVALLIAGFKAALVILFFMHVRWSSRMTKLFVCAGFFWLLLMILITMSDYDTRSWLIG